MVKEKTVTFEALRDEIRTMQTKPGQKRWLFVQNVKGMQEQSFDRPNSKGIAWTGNWSGNPRDTDMIAHWVADDARLYIGKRSKHTSIKPKQNSKEGRYKIPMEVISIFVVKKSGRQNASYQKLLQPEGSAIGKVTYTYWPDAEFDPDTKFASEAVALFNDEKIKVSDSNEILRAVWCRTAAHKKFKGDLLKAWDGKCALTGLKTPILLVASHIKPWAKCKETPTEQTCVDNGLLLATPIDQLFDKGFITFGTKGNVVLHKKGHSRSLIAEELAVFGLNALSLPKIKKTFTHGNLKYLKIHRKTIFNRK